jgi:hypothetical protein
MNPRLQISRYVFKRPKPVNAFGLYIYVRICTRAVYTWKVCCELEHLDSQLLSAPLLLHPLMKHATKIVTAWHNGTGLH